MYYLGIDGGGTKTAFVLINKKGEVQAYNVKKTCHYIQVGFDQFKNILKKGIEKLCKEANCSVGDIDYSFLGLPGFGENQDDIPILEGYVEEILKTKNFRCGNDVEAGWAGSLACEPGINIVGGTGAIGFGKDSSGNTARASGWGYYCGDEGSAHWLGKKLISLFGKEADGRLEKTPIYQIVRDEFNLKRDLDFITVVYDKLEMKRDKIASIAPLLYKAAEQGDQQAIDLYKEAAYEHSLTVKAIMNELAFNTEKKILISYSGGVFKAGKYVLEPLKNYLPDNTKLIKPRLLPVTGAALFALELYNEYKGNKDKEYDAVINSLKEEEAKIKRRSN